LDFSANGRYLIATCEFSGELLKVDVRHEKVVGTMSMPGGAVPQDVKLSPDGRIFYVADMGRGGVWKISGSPFRIMGFIRPEAARTASTRAGMPGTSTRPTAVRGRSP